MITLITGVPGSGKTLLAIAVIDKTLNNNKSAREHGMPERLIYSDIDGLNFDDESVIKVGSDFDWRSAEDGSLIVFDEVHQRWSATGKAGRSNDSDCRDLDQHRHRGFDFILITQWPTKLHHEARTNVGEHKHLVRTMGAKRATVYTWNQAQSSPDNRESKNSADSEGFRYPKHLFRYYKSATIHTHKLKIPKKVFVYLSIIFGLLGFSAYSYSNLTLLSANEELAEQAAASEGVNTPAPLPASTTFKQQLAGCISNDFECMCYTSKGEILNLDFASCKNIMELPLAFPLTIDAKS